MSVKKTPDGRIIEEKTKPISFGSAARAGQATPGKAGGPKTVLSSNNAGAGRRPSGGDSLDDKTRIVGAQSAGAPAYGGSRGNDALDDDTRMAGKSRGKRYSSFDSTERIDHPTGRGDSGGKTQLVRPGQSVEKDDNIHNVCEDPVVGWLVIENGPGQGYSMPLGVGMNAVGRGKDQRVCISFGDRTLSSQKHFLLSYDPRSKAFGIHRGDGSNLTYLNGSPIYASEILQNFDQIEAGATKFRFVAFCGEKFNWDE